MRIIVLGGAGAMGMRTVEDLSQAPGISSITIADINKDAAEKLVETFTATASAELDTLMLDAFQQDQVIIAMRNYDVVVSALGPYYVFEERMVSAAIEAGIDYISICDEWDVVDKIIRDFDKPAKEKGIRIICGMGASPGITNIAAIHLANQLDSVSKIDISVWLPLDTGAGAAAIEHGIYIMSGEMAVWRLAERRMIRPCSETVDKKFPSIGNQTLYNMGHSEPVTLPLALGHKGISDVNFYMGFGMLSFLLTGPSRLGLYNIPAVSKLLTKAFISVENVLSAKEPRSGASRIDVWGKAGGQEKFLTAFGVSTMQDSTALSLSVGAQMLAEKELLSMSGGVYAPEAIFDPTACLQRLWKKDICIYKDLEMTRPLF